MEVVKQEEDLLEDDCVIPFNVQNDDEVAEQENICDDTRFACFASIIFVSCFTYVVCSVIGFFTSVHLNATSRVDFLAVSADVVAIDLSSAIHVLTGFVVSQILETQVQETIKPYIKYVIVYVLIDSWIATFVASLFGSLFYLTELQFHYQDLGITFLEGLTGLQVLDWSQRSDMWHSLNNPIWFLHCVTCAAISVPFGLQGIQKFATIFPHYTHYFVLINSLLPIIVISFFSVYHTNSNVFYVNVTSVAYRLLECNLGIAVYYQVKTQHMLTLRFLELLTFCFKGIVVMFAMIWWTHLGLPITRSDANCIRLYHYSPCIKWHNAFLMRGCLVGLTFIAVVGFDSKRVRVTDSFLHELKLLPTMVSLCYPVSYIICLMLQVNFTRALMLENTILIVFCIPFLLHAIASIWINSYKDKCVNTALEHLDKHVAYIQNWRLGSTT